MKKKNLGISKKNLVKKKFKKAIPYKLEWLFFLTFAKNNARFYSKKRDYYISIKLN